MARLLFERITQDVLRLLRNKFFWGVCVEMKDFVFERVCGDVCHSICQSLLVVDLRL